MKKRLYNTAIFYLVLALLAGVFYREFTKINSFTAYSTLRVIHPHLIVLGVFVFLFILLLFKEQDAFFNTKLFKQFYLIYNIGLLSFSSMLLVRGIVTVKTIVLSHSIDAMISGIAGLTHILITVGLVLFFKVIKTGLNITNENNIYE